MRRTWATFLDFSPERDFKVEVPNCGRVRTQTLGAGQRGLVRHRMLRRQLLGPWRSNIRVLGETARLKISPLRAVSGARGRSVLFICPSEAVGDCVMYALAIECIARSFRPSRLGVAFTGSASDVFACMEFPVTLFPLLLPRDSLRTFDVVVEFEADVPAMRTIAETVITIDDAILGHLGLVRTGDGRERERRGPIRRIAPLPQSSTPIRTLPPSLTQTIARGLAQLGMDVEIIVNPHTRQGGHYLDALAGGVCPTASPSSATCTTSTS